MARFESREVGDKTKLFIDDKEVLKGWESFSGWFWFGVEIVEEGEYEFPDGVLKGKKWFGFIQGSVEVWGYFVDAEINRLRPRTWEIPQANLHYSGRR